MSYIAMGRLTTIGQYRENTSRLYITLYRQSSKEIIINVLIYGHIDGTFVYGVKRP